MSNIVEQIRKCKKCDLCKNQAPLVEKCKNCDVMWVGLSAKQVGNYKDAVPLDKSTNTGKVIAEIESRNENVQYYRTNVVKCAPLDNEGKLRYPTREELSICMNNLQSEISNLKPKVVFLLGGLAQEAVERKYKVKFKKKKDLFEYEPVVLENTCFFAIEHPSYMTIYKRKHIEDYKKAVVRTIESVIN